MQLRRFWRLVDEMARMALKADASRFYLSYLWWILEPLLYVAVFYAVFEVVLQNRHADFLVFLMCGKLTYVWFSKSVIHASRSIVASKGLISQLDLPKALFPLAVIQEGLYRQAAVFGLLFVFLFFRGYAPTLEWLWLLPVMLVNYLMIVAASLLGALLVCAVFDFMMLISLGMIFLLFTSGIFWDVRDLPDPAMTDLVLRLNPVAFIVAAYRQILIAGAAPAVVHLAVLGFAFAVAIAVLLGVYRRFSQTIALRAITA
ncbi:MAG: ABC transporter permease [Congregibacter sp.]